MIAIAIDGPAGAGKSTVARKLAHELGYLYVDTGALYRAIALYMTAHEVDIDSEASVEPMLGGVKLELRYLQGEQRVFLNGYDVSEDIRRPEISSAASHVSALPAVRTFLFALQQNMAVEHDVVMDGRDIGTVVLPKAQVKIFLTASDYAQVLREIQERDDSDRNRPIAPLRQAADAVLLDTTELTLEQVVARAQDEVRAALEKEACAKNAL